MRIATLKLKKVQKMDEKEKAKQLVEKFYKFAKAKSSGFLVSNQDIYIENAKECAKIAVEEIIKTNTDTSKYGTEF